ncbi:transglycosylase SLT domain-containing protein [Amycolatopsis sp. H6(2020)]|nr:transglycosylase SLT domain-containing protein [Amycolatopsis sp. H6(2020)]
MAAARRAGPPPPRGSRCRRACRLRAQDRIPARRSRTPLRHVARLGRTRSTDGWAQASAALEYAEEAPITDRDALRLIIAAESSGDPCVVNTWDANARRGTPSIGLVQTIRPTFDRWALPGYGDIRHPVDSIVAGVRYARARYGSEERTPGVLAKREQRKYTGY